MSRSPLSVVGALIFVLCFASCDDLTIDPPRLYPPHIDSDPSWSFDGQTIAFIHSGVTWVDYGDGTSRSDPDSMGIWTIRPDGSAKQPFIKGALLSPAWSPDGVWLAFVAGSQVWKIKTNGDSLSQVTHETTNFFPSWSPDGKWIASSTVLCPGDSTTCGVRITKSDGTESFWVASPASAPDWHPDGKSIIFSGIIGNRSGIVKYDLDGGQPEMILERAGWQGRLRPKYSPDGQTIAFGRDYHIWLVGSDGSNARQLTPHNNQGTFSWAPNGEQIVYATTKGLWVINVDGTGNHQLTFPPD